MTRMANFQWFSILSSTLIRNEPNFQFHSSKSWVTGQKLRYSHYTVTRFTRFTHTQIPRGDDYWYLFEKETEEDEMEMLISGLESRSTGMIPCFWTINELITDHFSRFTIRIWPSLSWFFKKVNSSAKWIHIIFSVMIVRIHLENCENLNLQPTKIDQNLPYFRITSKTIHAWICSSII